MKKFRKYFSWIFLAFSAGATAFAADYIPMTTKQYYAVANIPILTKVECEAQLGAVFSPATIIQNALDSLAKINQKSPSELRQECLEQAIEAGIKASDSIEPQQNYSDNISNSKSFQKPSYPSASFKQKYDSLRGRTDCLQSNYDAVKSAQYEKDFLELKCSKEFVADDSPEGQKIKKDAIDIESEFGKWLQKRDKAIDLADQVSLIISDTSSFHSNEIRALDEKISCYNPVPKNSNGYVTYENNHASSCKNKWITKGERDELVKKKEELTDKLNIRRSLLNVDRESFKGILFDKLMSANELDSIRELVRNVRCYNPFEKDTGPYNGFFNSTCPVNSETSKEAAESAIEKIKGTYPNLKAEISTWAEKKVKEKEIEKKQLQEEQANRYSAYSRTRLFAKYKAYIKKGGDLGNFSPFCSEYEALQFRDKKFADLGFNITMFLKPADWKFAENYGSTEAEVAAIRDFSGNYFRTINTLIWQKNLDKKMLHIKR